MRLPLGVLSTKYLVLGICVILIAFILQKQYRYIRISEDNTAMAARCLTLLSGAKMPMVGLGTWMSPRESVKEAVTIAIEAGYRHIDCAHDYENEAEVGDGINTKIQEGAVKRDDLFVTSKLWLTFFSPDRVKIGFEESRKKLKLYYLDLFLMHFPFALKDSSTVQDPNDVDSLSDESIDYVDTWKELIKLQKAGLAKSIGVSNFNQYQIERLIKETSHPPDVNQFECHPYLDQTDLVNYCQSKGIVVTGYSPLGSPGNRGYEEPNLLTETLLHNIASKHDKTVPQVLLRYQIQRDIVVIPKSITSSNIVANLDVFNFALTNDEMTSVKSLNRNFRTCDVDGWASRSHKYYPFRKDYKEA